MQVIPLGPPRLPIVLVLKDRRTTQSGGVTVNRYPRQSSQESRPRSLSLSLHHHSEVLCFNGRWYRTGSSGSVLSHPFLPLHWQNLPSALESALILRRYKGRSLLYRTICRGLLPLRRVLLSKRSGASETVSKTHNGRQELLAVEESD